MPPILPLSFIHRLPNFVQFGYRPFCSSTTRFTNDASDSDKGGDDADFFEGLYFDGEIPRDRIKQKFTLASGPGGSNINKNPTKAEVRFLVEKADWIPRRVRERLVERHPGCVNKRGEFAFTSQITRYQHQNMEDCFRRLHNMLLDCSEELVREVHREYVSPDHVKELELRKERSEEYRLAGKSQNSRKKQNRRSGLNI